MTRHVQKLIVCLGCVVALIVGGASHAAAQQSGPVAAYGFEEGAGTTTADASGNGQLGMLSGAAWSTAGRYGRGLQFDGLNDVVTILNTSRLDLRTGMTIEAWVHPTRVGFPDPILAKDAPGGAVYALEGGLNENRPEYRLRLIGQSERRIRGGSIQQNGWSHVAATYDGSTMRLYLNGVLTMQRIAAGAIMGSTGALRIGADLGSQQFFAGRIDEVRVYARPLTAAEIQADMATPVVPVPVDTTPPTVALQEPAAGATVSGVVGIAAAATDNDTVSSVRFLVDGQPVDVEQTSAPYAISWNSTTVANGPHTLATVAVDATGNSATSAPVAITVLNDLVAPAVSVAGPAGIASGSILLSASAIDDIGVAGVQFLLDGAPLGAEDSTAPFELTWDTTVVANGDHMVTAIARDASGKSSTSPIVIVNVANDGEAPVVGIASPTAGSTVSDSISVAAAASDDLGVVAVQFLLDGNSLGEDTTAPYEASWDTTGAANGQHVLSAIARDASGKSTTSAAVTVTVANNGAPVGVDDVATLAEDSASAINVLANDSDPDGDTLAITAVTSAAHGTVVLTGGGTGLTYTPNANFFGSDSFTYTVSDGSGESDSATVRVTVTSVNDPPTAVDDAFTVMEDGGNVLLYAVTQNDTIAPDSGETLQIVEISEPAHGRLGVGGETGVPDYIPNSNFCGTDSVRYTVSDGNGGSATATVVITVTCVDDLIQAVDDAFTVAEDSTAVALDVLANDIPGDSGGALRVGSCFGVSGSAGINGTVTVAPDRSHVLFTPTGNFAGVARFSCIIEDQRQRGANAPFANVVVTVTPVNDAPVAANDAAVTPQGTAASGNVLANDTDVDSGATLIARLVAGPAAEQGVVVLNADGTFTYSPAPGFVGAATFTYVANDGEADSNAGVATITVTDVNDAPTAADDAATTDEDMAIEIAVLTNDGDPDGEAVVLSSVGAPAHGTAAVNATGSVTYRPEANYFGSDSFVYTIRDAQGLSATATVSVTVSSVNDVPVVSIAAPVAASTVSGGITMTASASDDTGIAGVQFMVDGASIGPEDTTAPYEASWDTTAASNGTHVLTAVVRDLSETSATSAPVSVTVENDGAAPAVSITAPAAETTVSDSVSIAASASDDLGVAGVQFRLDGANLGAEDTTAPYEASWDTTSASNGDHVLTAVARDASGKSATSAAVTVTVSNDTTAPAVSITAPAAESTVSGSISVSASASDDISVAGVQFRLDGANLGAEDTSAPYEASWDTTSAPNGNHVLTAIARDGSGKTTASASVTVSVANDGAAPAVSITSPAAESTVSGSISVSASASDDISVAGVQFRLDGANLGAEDTTAPYEASWDTTSAANGNHVLTAIARDASGKTTTSASVTVTITNDGAAPAVSITAPAAASTISGNVAVSASATDDIGVAAVQFRLDGANLGAEDTTSPYEASWDSTSAANGDHVLTAIARDASGKTTTSAGVTVTVSNDTAAPAVSITAPGAGSTVSGSIGVRASATDDMGVAGVQFRLDGANLGAEDTTAPYEASWDTTSASNGEHVLTAIARDASGKITTSASVTVSVANDGAAPAVSITAPAAASTVSGSLAVKASATDDIGVTGVQFLLDGTNLGAEDTTAPYEASWDTTSAANGDHVLTAIARDASGKTTTSASVTVSVANDGAAPAVSITAPVAESTVSGSLAVKASATDDIGVVGVQFLLNGANLGPEDRIAPYSATWHTTTVTNGTHVLTAIARDASGKRTTSAAVSVTVANDGAAPTVSITAPGAGSSVSGSIAVSASASDDIGVAGVQFLIDGANLGAEDTTAPYEASWDTTGASNGDHVLTAIARDASGKSTTSASVTVAVANDGAAPAVSITAPAAASTVSGSIAVKATATDDIGVAGVQFRLDGANLGAEDTTAPYEANWDSTSVANGDHALTAIARDASGKTTTSATVTVTVSNDAAAPEVSITAPAAASTVSGSITVKASASDDIGVAGVQFRMDGANLGAEDTTAPYEANWDSTGASNGDHILTAVARDASGKTTTSAAVTVTVSNDTAAPAVSITAPAAASTVSGSIAVKASATDDVGVVGVQFRLDGANLGVEDTTAPYEASWDTTGAANGNHVLTAIARDASGKTTTSAAVTVTVSNDGAAPAVSITAPAAASTVSGSIGVNASASDDIGVAGVQFLLNGANLGPEDTTAPYSATWHTTTVTNGTHVLTAIARDASGKRTTSAAVSVTVANDATAPTVSITAPGAGSSLSGSIVVSASATDDSGVAGVQFLLDGVNLGAEDTTAPYSTTWNTATASNGTHALTAVARDASGKSTTSSTVNVTVSNEVTAPTVSITAPVSGATLSGSIALIASATDDIGVVGVQFMVDGVNIGAEDATVPYSTTWATGTHSNGAHTIAAIARDASGKRTTSSGVVVNVANDNTAPLVSITAPAAGSTVSGAIAVTASATDDIGVIGVQFLLDGVALGAEDTAAPYEVSWSTASATNGTHALAATARDASGKRTTSASVAVTVSNVTNPNDPSKIGQWTAPFNWPLVTVHMSLMHTGEVLAWDGQDNGGVSATIWNPATNQFTAAPNGFTNLFCASHAQLADGRILVAGGHGTSNLGTRDANVYDPITRQWTALPRMAFARWYPTATTLPDGRVLVVGGAINCFTCIAEVPEIYDPVANTWTQVSTGRLNVPLYPYDIVLPDGRVANVGANEGITVTRTFNLQTQSWSVVDPVAVDGGSAAMYRPGKILKSGSWTRNTDLPNVPSASTAYVIDMNETAPRWRQVQPMAFPRAHHILTLLPDGNVLATGGQEGTDGITTSEAVLDAEIWSPVTETWTPAGRMQTPRLYHGNALLLPDGRVLVSGGGRLGGARDYLNGEIYSPPYLFKGARPTIGATPERIDFGTEFDVATPNAATIKSVVLLRPGSVTHTFNTEQRYVELSFRQNGSGLIVTAPANANLAPPGYYMLFLVNGNGVPSVASFVRLPSPAEDLQAPSSPSSLVAAAGTGTATLQWAAATDNTGVAIYNVHRSTSPGFAPTAANRIAQTTSLGYFDAGLQAGSYFYVVTAQDVVGNISAASNEAAVAVVADSVAPTIAITAPAEGQDVLNVVTVSATAADNVGVAGVQFKVDGVNLGAEDLVAPFSVPWNTGGVPNGTHVISAVARDGAGNVAQSAPVTVTVSNNGTAPAGLMAAYNFNEGTGTVLNDRSGSGNPGTVSGAAWTASGHTGSALTFDGVNDWVTVADSPDLALSDGMTLEAWIYPTVHADWRTVILKEMPAGLVYALYSSNDANRPATYVNGGAGDIAATGPASLPLNAWTHLAVTYDGSVLRLFVNGNQVTSTPMSGTIVKSGSPLRLGGNSVWNEFFAGRLDDVRIYNRALGAAEIQVDMATPVP